MTEYALKNGRRLRLRPDDAVGKGGEADIYIDGSYAIKIFKTPSHADLAGDPQEQAKARDRIADHQRKLPAFPKGLPTSVIVPRELVYDTKGQIAGYCMDLISDAEVLYSYGERSFRDAGVTDETAVAVLADLHRTVAGVHAHPAHIVISDFNDLNVLVKGRAAYLIDADSMSWGTWRSRQFTARFVDPLLCDPKAKSPMLCRPHTQESDWYAYAVMLMQVLLFVGPYGGVYMPKDPAKRMPHDQRPLRRITVFDPEVKYPKPARPYGILPDALLDYFEKTFVKDVRGLPPRALVEELRFTTCPKCKIMHARGVCPSCVTVMPARKKEIHTGEISAFKEFSTSGVILHAVLEGDTLRYLYHEGGAYKREGSTLAMAGALDPHLRYRISGTRTLMGRGEQAALFERGAPKKFTTDGYGLLPLFDANGKNIFFARAGGLWRVGDLGVDYPERWGDVLPKQTLFWVGEQHGFGFYRAGELARFFVFGANHPGINDSITLPPLRGQLIDAVCCFGSDRIWFFAATSESGRTRHRCHVLDSRGTYLGSAEADAGDGSWLSSLRGKCAAGGFLLGATDEGVARVEIANGQLAVAKVFTATAEFVDTDSRLLPGKRGLYVAKRDEIWRLVLK